MAKWMICAGSLLTGMAAWAQQPASQPTDLSFYNLKPYGFNISFTPSSADGYLVVRSLSPVTFTPQDGVAYEKGQGVAPDTKVFSVGPSAAGIKEVLAGTTYYFAVFAYNGSGSGIDYKNTDPLTGSITSPEGGPGNYYAGVSSNPASLLSALKTRLNTGRVFQSYTPGYINNLMNNFYLRDTVDGQLVSVCQYTGEIYLKDPPYGWWGNTGNPGEFTREHALPRSWMLTGGNTDNQDGADYHNLFPVDQAKANAKRSNYPYGIVQNVSFQYMGGKFGTNNQGISVYEPRNAIKGDVARAQFYMMVCYNGNGGTWGYQSMPTYAPQQNQDVLRTWHAQDPPDDFEKTRNEYIYSVQFNRNPFIDFPELADCINFNTMTLISGCTPISLGAADEKIPEVAPLFPNPASELFSLANVPAAEVKVYVTDVNGRTLLTENFGNLTPGDNQLQVDISALSSGLYWVHVQSDSFVEVQQLIVTK